MMQMGSCSQVVVVSSSSSSSSSSSLDRAEGVEVDGFVGGGGGGSAFDLDVASLVDRVLFLFDLLLGILFWECVGC